VHPLRGKGTKDRPGGPAGPVLIIGLAQGHFVEQGTTLDFGRIDGILMGDVFKRGIGPTFDRLAQAMEIGEVTNAQ
jgi:hypothetical protein